MDRNEIPHDRELRKSNTCCDECAKKLKELRRRKKEQKVCRQCGAPSSPEERALFAAWRRQQFPPKKRGRPPQAKPAAEPTIPPEPERNHPQA